MIRANPTEVLGIRDQSVRRGRDLADCRCMSHSYYRNPKGRMIKMGIMFGSLCFSAYMLPKTIDKLGESGLGSMLQPGGGIGADAQRLLGEGGIDGLLNAERQATKPSGPMVITPSGTMSETEYRRLQQRAQQVAPIRIVKGHKPDSESPNDSGTVQADAAGQDEAIQRLMELVEQQKKGG